jgi:hypothetical protein
VLALSIELSHSPRQHTGLNAFEVAGCLYYDLVIFGFLYTFGTSPNHPTLVGCGVFGLIYFFISVGVESTIFIFRKVSLVHVVLVSLNALLCPSVINENIQPLIGSKASRL